MVAKIIKGRFPSVSPDDKFLFFCGEDLNIYWASSSVIEDKRELLKNEM